jgi:hypothetical protein
MPIEIKELHIRVSVDSEGSGSKADASGGDGTNIPGSVKDAIVSECIEQILQILQNRSER